MTVNPINRKPRVLVVPLNWGLGHATRLIPLIRELKELDAEILMGGGPDQIKILKQEFQDLKVLPLPFLKIRFSRFGSQILKLGLQVPKILITILREHFALRSLIRCENLDAVISDNCFGLWNKSVFSIFITHQLWIRLPGRIRWLEKTINRVNHWFINHYNLCWVPDYPGEHGYSGILSQNLPAHPDIRYIGILSRFANMSDQPAPKESTNKNVLVILSGPEKQRSQFENRIKEELADLPEGYSIKIIRGLPSDSRSLGENWFNHVDARTFYSLIRESDIVISRAGYSTIMDLLSLGKSAFLIPTPGQTEQEYLAKILSEKGFFRTISQSEFKWSDIINTPLPDIPKHIQRENLLKGELVRFMELLVQRRR